MIITLKAKANHFTIWPVSVSGIQTVSMKAPKGFQGPFLHMDLILATQITRPVHGK